MELHLFSTAETSLKGFSAWLAKSLFQPCPRTSAYSHDRKDQAAKPQRSLLWLPILSCNRRLRSRRTSAFLSLTSCRFLHLAHKGCLFSLPLSLPSLFPTLSCIRLRLFPQQNLKAEHAFLLLLNFSRILFSQSRAG